MSAHRFMTTVVCDDVRREQGNKLSYMGIYTGNIFVPSFPFTMAKLCFVMSVTCPGEEEPPQTLTFRLLRDEEVIAEMSLPPQDLVAQTPALPNVTKDATRRMLGTVLQLFPFNFAGPCVLRARALCDGQELKGGSWSVEAPSAG